MLHALGSLVLQGCLDWISDCVVVISIKLQPIELQKTHSPMLFFHFSTTKNYL
jgi:hypothetical protein